MTLSFGIWIRPDRLVQNSKPFCARFGDSTSLVQVSSKALSGAEAAVFRNQSELGRLSWITASEERRRSAKIPLVATSKERRRLVAKDLSTAVSGLRRSVPSGKPGS